MPAPDMSDLKNFLSDNSNIPTQEHMEKVNKRLDTMMKSFEVTNPGDLTMTPMIITDRNTPVVQDEAYRRKQKKLRKLERKMDALRDA